MWPGCAQIKERYTQLQPYGEWLDHETITLADLVDSVPAELCIAPPIGLDPSVPTINVDTHSSASGANGAGMNGAAGKRPIGNGIASHTGMSNGATTNSAMGAHVVASNDAATDGTGRKGEEVEAWHARQGEGSNLYTGIQRLLQPLKARHT